MVRRGLKWHRETEHDHLVDVDSGEVLELASKEWLPLNHGWQPSLVTKFCSQHSVLRVRKLKRALSDKTT